MTISEIRDILKQETVEKTVLEEIMADERKGVRQLVDAYIRRDSGAAAAICEADDEVDALFSSTVLELCSQISRDSAAVPEHVDFMFIAKYIERMADHATNIAEWAIFIDTGVHPNLNDTQAGK